jgi:hypothetical protein
MPDVMAIIPKEEQLDAVAKIRVSQPQSLIDTDFEYGLQPTKWEFINMTNNRPTAFYNPTSPLTITNLTSTGNAVTVTTATPPAVGTPVYIQGANNALVNGWFLVATVSAGVSFTYNLVNANSLTSSTIYDSTKTYVYSGTLYAGADIPVSASAGAAFTNSGTTVTGTTTYAHGLSVGNLIYVVGTTASTNAPNGTWTVVTVPTANTFTFTVNNTPTGTITATAGATTTLYQAPNGYSIHRAYDGGVQFSAGANSPNAQMIRQTRRYFRYQSGKSIEVSTGSILRNAFFVDSLTSSGSTVTVNCKFPHNMSPGAYIQVAGAIDNNYNGIFQITGTTNTTMTYSANVAPATSPDLGFPVFVTSYTWYGATHRLGIFDQQNGMFFEYDGQNLNVVKRYSTQQLSGTIAVTSNSNAVTGTGTAFSSQLTPGDFVVIRGQSYRIQWINSDTSMAIAPEYRAATASNIVLSKTLETRYPQSTWNLDPCDGTGPSGYKVNLSKMQMFYLDYSWYGAGFVRWGMRTANGTKTYCHKVPNNNLNTEAWMRSGNLPAHYESFSVQPITTLTSSVTVGATTINVASTTGFPPTGAFRISAPGDSGAIEYISYTGLTSTSFTGCTRGKTGGSAATAFTYSVTAPVAVELANTSQTTTSSYPSPGSINHWGTSAIMDGQFNNDLQFSFNGGMSAPLAVQGSATSALMSLRLGPSVDTGITGVLGAREVINRMQLKLQSIRVLSAGIFQISAYLNANPASGTFSAVGGSSLSQIAYHTANTTVTSGEAIYSFYTNNSGGTNLTLTEEDLTTVRDLGNSILGGGVTNTVPTSATGLYPDGPDVVTIVARNLTATPANVTALISWTEAQA